jgi:hypothetical protein
MATLAQLEEGMRRARDAGKLDYARILGQQIIEARKNPANMIPDSVIPETITRPPEPTMGEKVIGGLDAAATLATAPIGAVGAIGGALKGLAQQILDGKFGTPEAVKMVEKAAAEGMQAGMRTPATQAGGEMVESVGKALEFLPPVIPVAGPIGAVGRAAQGIAPLAEATAMRGLAAAKPIAQKAAQAAKAVPEGMGKMVMGDSGLPEGVSVARKGSGGAAATPIELQRATEAEMAGLRLTEGETKRSPQMLAWEKEKAKTPEYQAQFLERQQENNRAALTKFDQLIDDTGAETGDMSNTGIKVVDTLMKGYAQEKAKTNALYEGFRNSPEAQMPVNQTPVLEFLNSQPVGVSGMTGVTDLARQNAVRLGIAQMDDAGNLIPAPTTLGKLEEFRQSVSAIGASTPNDRRLVTILKRQIDNVGDPVGGQVTRAMRAQRQRQAQKYENRAIVANLLAEKKGMSDAKVPIEDVFQKTILSARPSEIQHIKRVLLVAGGDEGKQAWKELQGATLRHLNDSAVSGIGADNLPVVSAAKLRKAVDAMDKNGKLNMVLGVSGAEQVRNLARVLEYIQTNPPMTSINNSGTARTVMALITEAGLTGAATGVPLPIIQGMKAIRDSVKDRKIKARITQALNYKPQGVAQ